MSDGLSCPGDQIIGHNQVEPVSCREVRMSGECHNIILAQPLAEPVFVIAVLRISWNVPLSTWAFDCIFLNCRVKLLITLSFALNSVHLPFGRNSC